MGIISYIRSLIDKKQNYQNTAQQDINEYREAQHRQMQIDYIFEAEKRDFFHGN